MPLIVPKCYLDTAHLINIWKVRNGGAIPPTNNRALRDERQLAYRRIDDFLLCGWWGVVFNPAAVLEWIEGNATEESALEPASVIDSWPVRYEAEQDLFVFLAELFDELRRIEPSLEVPRLSPLLLHVPGATEVRALGLLAERYPGFLKDGDVPTDGPEGRSFPVSVPFLSACGHVRQALGFKRRNASAYAERDPGFKAALETDMQQAPKDPIGNAKLRVAWMKRFLRIERILASHCEQSRADDLLGRVDFDRCPAMRLWWRARDQRVRMRHPAKENDSDDWGTMQIVPYVDLMLTDQAFCDVLLRADRSLSGKVVAQPPDAARVMSDWSQRVSRPGGAPSR